MSLPMYASLLPVGESGLWIQITMESDTEVCRTGKEWQHDLVLALVLI